MKRIFVELGTGLIALVLTGSPSAAAAHPGAAMIKYMNVRHSDLDLARDADARKMLARLEAAATSACGGRPTPVSGDDRVGQAKHRQHRICKARAVDDATQRLGAPLVRAAWLKKAAMR